jgi:hypothetical protein
VLLMRPFFLIAALSCALSLRAEQPAPDPHPPTPPTQPAIPLGVGGVQSIPQVADWAPYLADLQGSDKAKQEAAAQVFLDSGQLGYNVLERLLKNPDKDLVTRVRDIRGKIDERSYKLFQEAMTKRERIFSTALDLEQLEDLKNTLSALGSYASVLQVKQQSFQILGEVRRSIAAVEGAKKQLIDLDRLLKATPPPEGIYRAAMLISRATAYRALLRHKDVLAAAQEAETASGAKGRLTPQALRIQAETYQRLLDLENARNICRKIMHDFPRSMEMHFAHQALFDSYIQEQRFDDAYRELKEYLAAFPIDDEAQQSAMALLTKLMDDEHDYKRVAELAEWMIATLPLERLDVETVKCFGGCNEYVLKDYAKAERAYSMLHEYFSDSMDPKDIERVIERVHRKAGGKFEKEPLESDEGPKGAMAGFLRCIRTRNAKDLALFVPDERLDEFKEQLEEPGDSLVPLLTFCDVIVSNVEYSPTKDSAMMFLSILPAAGNAAKEAVQPAMKEGGKWKVVWRNLDAEAALPNMPDVPQLPTPLAPVAPPKPDEKAPVPPSQPVPPKTEEK